MSDRRRITVRVNGRDHSREIETRTTLADFLRHEIELTGTHLGCEHGVCGACTVLLDGLSARACLMLAVQAVGKDVTKVEGLATGDQLAPLQQAFRDNHGLQCGFCTPGMIMTAVDIVNRKGNSLDEATIRHELEGNICRCTGYHNIVKSVAQGAREMAAPAQAAE